MDVTFFVLDGFSNIILSCLMEPIRVIHEHYREDISWQVVTVDDHPVKSSSGLTLAPTCPLAETEASDMLVILSSNGFRQHPTPETLRVVSSLVRCSRCVVGADAGGWLLAAGGFLDDLPATVHWSILSEFAETFPHVRVTRQPFVMEGRFWSCGSASTALEFMLTYIRQTFGPAKAFWASSMFMHDGGPHSDDSRLPTTFTRPEDGKLRDIMNIMLQTLEHPLPLTTLAERAYVSPRTLSRLFRDRVGLAPGQYYQSLRIAQARELAETTMFGLREIALRCGYGDAAALCKAFKRMTGYSIRSVLRPERSSSLPPQSPATHETLDKQGVAAETSP